jgi:hypothetical protein
MVDSNGTCAIRGVPPNRVEKTRSDIGAGDEGICCSIRESDSDFYAYSNWITMN